MGGCGPGRPGGGDGLFVNTLRTKKGNVKEAPLKNEITQECNFIRDFLIEKNQAYGNSAIQPINIFSQLNNIQQINCRIDDKLNRLAKGNEYPGDDTILDLIGYLILLRIATLK